MSMNEFRRLAAKIDQHMQRLAAEGVNDAPATINRMMGYVSDLHKIWAVSYTHLDVYKRQALAQCLSVDAMARV